MESKHKYKVKDNRVEVYAKRGIFFISPEDLDLVVNYRWHITNNGYIAGLIDKKITAMHKVIIERKNGKSPQTLQVDHINKNGLDNRRDNLRPCTPQGNMRNRNIFKNNKSGYKGVDFYKITGKWRTQISADGNRKHIGYFSTAIEAAKAYDAAVREVYGEFAVLNFH